MHDPLQRLYRTKLALLATLLLVAGLALLFFARWLGTISGWTLLRSWPIADVGSALFTTGLLGVALQYFDGQDSEVRATQRLERVIGAATPAMRDAVTVATSAWYLRPQPGIDAAAKDSFELLDFTVDGEPRTIRRSSKQDSQTYSVNIGREAMDAGKAVHVAYTYRTVLPVGGHRLLLRVDQPTRGLAVELDYSDTELSEVQVMDFISSSQKTRIGKSPASVPGKVVSVEFDGWVFPRSGVVFVWR